jgi:hypothetical protein
MSDVRLWGQPAASTMEQRRDQGQERTMLTGNFTRELTDQRMGQLRTEVASTHAVQRAVQSRRQREQLSKPVAWFYRIATRGIALSLMLLVGLSTTAHAMPAAREVVDKGAKSGHQAVPLTKLVGTGSASDAWVGFAFIFTVVVVLTAMSARRHSATA